MNLIKKIAGAAALALTLALPGTSQAATVYENAWTTSNLGTSWCSACDGYFKGYAKFTLDSAATIGKATWLSESGYDTDTVLEIYDATRTQLVFSQTALASEIVNTAFTQYGWSNPIERTMTVTGLALASGTYWISFYGQNNVFYTVDEQAYSGLYYQDGVGAHEGRGAFRLESGISPVPVPATLPLLAGALAGLGLIRRKRA